MIKRLFLIFLVAIAANTQQNALLLPWTPQQFTNTNGTVLANGKVCTYQAGTSTGLATYTDSTASVANSVPPNAILLDSTGRPTSGGIWLKTPLAYKIVVLTAGSDNTCNTGVIVKSQDQVIMGAGAGLNLNNTFSGTNAFTGFTSIKNQSNVRWVDGTSYACSDVGLNAAIADVIAGNAGGGTVYASCPGTNTIAATVNVGSASAHIELIFLSQSIWNCTINNAANDCWFLFPNSSMEGAAHGANQTQLTISAAASVRSIVKTFSHITPGVATHVRMRNLEIHNGANGTIVNAVVDLQGMYDSSFSDITIDRFSGKGLWIHDFTSPAGGNSLAFYNTLLDGQAVSGARPLVIEQNNASSNTSSLHFFGGDWGHPGAGQFLVEINGHTNTGFGHISIEDIYMESNTTDTTTALIKVADVSQVNFNNIRMTRLSASSTAPGIAISETAANLTGNIGAKNLSVGGGTGCVNTNIITNSVPGAGTGNVATASCALADYTFLSSELGDESQVGGQWIFKNNSTAFGNISSARGASVTPNFPVFIYQPANTVTGMAFFQNTISEWRVGMPANVSDYCVGTNDTLTTCPMRLNSAAPNNSLNLNSSGQLAGMSVASITNGPGLQIFNTSTTCSTAASVGATCTTANITLPVTEPDTSYRMWCTGRGFASGVPVFLSATNVSTTQFTISIAALTAAAASFSSYDCVAGHN